MMLQQECMEKVLEIFNIIIISLNKLFLYCHVFFGHISRKYTTRVSEKNGVKIFAETEVVKSLSRVKLVTF